jgi:hypothetical protein
MTTVIATSRESGLWRRICEANGIHSLGEMDSLRRGGARSAGDCCGALALLASAFTEQPVPRGKRRVAR